MSVRWIDAAEDDGPGCWEQVAKPVIGALLLACCWFSAPVVFGAIWAAARAALGGGQ